MRDLDRAPSPGVRIQTDLGFHAEWLCLPASDLGFAHKRNRWFCLAYSKRAERRENHDGVGSSSEGPDREGEKASRVGDGKRVLDVSKRRRCKGEDIYLRPTRQDQAKILYRGAGYTLGHHQFNGLEGRTNQQSHNNQELQAVERTSNELADTNSERRQQIAGSPLNYEKTHESTGRLQQDCRNFPTSNGYFAIPGPGLGGAGVVDRLHKLYAKDPEAAWRSYQAELRNTLRWQDLLVRYPWLQPAISQEEVESYFHGLPDGMARMVVDERTSALRAAGNGVVSLQAAVAFTELLKKII